jgi:PAS domain S-box-containing protein
MLMRKKISLLQVLVFPFVGLTVLSVAIVGYISIRNGQLAVHRVAEQLRCETNTRIVKHLNQFLHAPHRINQINAEAISNGSINAGDQDGLIHRFREQILMFDSVTSINFGNTAGGLANAGREGAEGLLYTIHTDEFKRGPFHKYATDRQGQRRDLLGTLPDFDCRERSWYIDAVRKNKDIWSDIYILFTGQDLSFSANRPVYDQEGKLLGVLGVNLFLSHLSDFLSGLTIGKTGQSFIMERTGLLIAGSTDEKPLSTSSDGASLYRIDARKSTVPMVQKTAKALSDKFNDFQGISAPHPFQFTLDGRIHFGQVTPYQDPYGLDWLIVTTIPEDDFMAPIRANKQMTIVLMVLTIIVTAGAGIFITRKLIEPISTLTHFAKTLPEGKWDTSIRYHSRISEINTLTHSFNYMTGQLKQWFDELNHEIEERKQAEKTLRRERLRLGWIIEGTNAGTWEWNVQTGEAIFNRRWAEIIGYTFEEIMPISIETWLKFCHPDDLKESERLLKDCFEGRSEYYHCECRMKHKDGSWIWVLDRGKVITWTDDGKPGWMYGTHQDITEHKHAEAEKGKLQEQLTQARKAESLGRMAGAVAHHFNNQLSVVMGNLELVLGDLPDDAEHRENLSQSLEAGHKAAEVSRQMLRYLGHISGSQTTIDLSDVCRQRLALLQSSLPNGVTLNVDFPESGPFVHADAGQIQQILTHLFTNAQESLPGNQGNIGLSIHTVSHEDIPPSNRFPLDWQPQDIYYACLEISDTGAGISKENIGNLFDPFYTTKFTGRGMGLPVTMGNLKTHGGCIFVDSEPGCGSVFRVCLPITTKKENRYT